MKKKLIGVALAAVMGLSCLTACGGGNDDPGLDPGDIPEDQSVTINFWGWGSAAEQANYQTLVNKFMEENKNITVIYHAENSSTYMTTLRNSANTLPELFYMPDEDFLEWAANGMLKDISGHVTETELNALWPDAVNEYYFNPNTAKLGKGNGAKLYGLPKDLGPFTLIYNKTLLDKLITEKGLNSDDIYALLSPTTPMTWQQFRTLLKQIDTDPNDNIYGISHYPMQLAIYSNDAMYFNEDASESRITDKNFTDALQFVADLHLVDKVMPSAANQVSTNGYQRFSAQGSVFSFMGPWDCAEFWETLTFEYDVVPMPYNGENPNARSTAWVGSMGYCVSAKANSLKTNAAMALAKYLCYNEDAQRTFYQLGQQVPNITSMANGEYLNDSEGLLAAKTIKGNPALTAADCPKSRSVWLDTINGFSDTDKIGGKVRPTWYTYNSDWSDMFEEYVNTQGLWTGAKTAVEVCAAYNNTFQVALNEMRAQLG